jgi:hypothetical protein
MDADTGYSIFDSAEPCDPELTTEGIVAGYGSLFRPGGVSYKGLTKK